MKLGDIARVARGVVTGDKHAFIMSRTRARELGIEDFVRPVLGSTNDLPRSGSPVVRDHPQRDVILIASLHDVNRHSNLKNYLGDREPKISNVRPAPIAASYTGVPRFAANPDGLVITNALYTVTPRQNLTDQETLHLVERLNRAMAKHPKSARASRLSPRQFDEIEIEG